MIRYSWTNICVVISNFFNKNDYGIITLPNDRIKTIYGKSVVKDITE